MAQRGADALYAWLKEQNLLRKAPAQWAAVKHVQRDATGRIVAVIETLEQVE